MLIVGLTGSFGTGKSTVAGMFKAKGAVIIDADAVMRALLAPGGKAEKKVAKAFGHAILQSSKIDRSALANIVFKNPRELKKLTDILYPIGLKQVKKQITQYRHKKIVILDVPLLFESGWDKLCDLNIVVQSSRSLQIQRLIKRMKITKAGILQRIKSQMPIKDKLQRADIVINNNGSLKQTSAQVEAIVYRLLQRIN